LFRSTALNEPTAGFTLIEVLAALMIVALTLSSIGMLVAANSRGTRSIEDRLARLETARAVITALPDRHQLDAGTLSGEIAGQPWRVAVSPFAANTPRSPVPWVPQTVVVTVQSPNGGATQLSTIRLQRRETK
jgi:general secretion pathway protein I